MERPYVICHILASLNGKISGDFMSAPECAPIAAKYGQLRDFFNCQATLYGTVTMADSFADGIVSELPQSKLVYMKEDYIAQSDASSYIVSVDPKGILKWSSKYIEKKNRPRAHVIEVLTRQVSTDYLAYLRKFDISYLFAGNEHLDCGLVLRKLKEQVHIDRLMLAGGGLMNGSLLQDDLIDELSLVVAPVVSRNGTSPSVFERLDSLSSKDPSVFSLDEVTKLENSGLWLRYKLKH